MPLSFLRPLYTRPGPWASVYLDASHDTEDAAKILDLRWRAARERLAAADADDATVAALDTAVREHRPRPGRYGLAAFAAPGAAKAASPYRPGRGRCSRTAVSSVPRTASAAPAAARRSLAARQRRSRILTASSVSWDASR